ncbi:MAG: hypothetical protein C4310_03705 [Chloroflexota bacterium]
MAQSNIKAFMDRRGLADFDELMRWSTEDVGRFWEAVLADLDIRFDRPYERILDTSRGIAWAQWCVGGKLNIVTNCLDKWLGTPTQNRAAVCWEGEEGQTHTLTYLDLYYEVNRMANALRSLGLKKGDAIGLYMPMIPEIVIALLAIVKIGGIVLPLFSGYAAPAIATRLIDAEAQVLFTADGVYRRGQVVPMKDIADEAVAQSPSVQHVITVKRVGREALPWQAGRDHWWHELIEGQPRQAASEPTDAEDPPAPPASPKAPCIPIVAFPLSRLRTSGSAWT